VASAAIKAAGFMNGFGDARRTKSPHGAARLSDGEQIVTEIIARPSAGLSRHSESAALRFG